MKNIKEICIVVFLGVIIFVRFQVPDNKVQWISIVNFAGLLIALIDLFYTIYHNNKNNDKIKSYIFIVIVILAIIMIPFALICTQYVSVSPKINDFFTLLALLFTLSKQLWIDIIEQFYFLWFLKPLPLFKRIGGNLFSIITKSLFWLCENVRTYLSL